MSYYSYIVARDYGFAPNPFYGTCTLATCKPIIRRCACIGDWILGCGSVSLNCQKHLIFAMKVTGKLSFSDYWGDPQYQIKKPKMTGTLINLYGDNIYHYSNDEWIQSDSHHSLEEGITNYKNLNHDTKTDVVLISDMFYYFGKSAIKVPEKFVENVIHKGRNHSRPNDKWGDKFISYLEKKYEFGLHNDPIQFDNFKRFKGV